VTSFFFDEANRTRLKKLTFPTSILTKNSLLAKLNYWQKLCLSCDLSELPEVGTCSIVYIAEVSTGRMLRSLSSMGIVGSNILCARTRFIEIFRTQTLTNNTMNKVFLFVFESNFKNTKCCVSIICIRRVTPYRSSMLHLSSLRFLYPDPGPTRRSLLIGYQ
jgi:hypothetical protein